jgi:hypothetical protein
MSPFLLVAGIPAVAVVHAVTGVLALALFHAVACIPAFADVHAVTGV